MNLFNYTVAFGKSIDYLRLMAVIHGIAVFMLLTSGIGVVGKLFGVSILLLQCFFIWSNPTPEPRYLQLEYLNKKWFLLQKNGNTQLFTQHRVLIECGLFFILHLSSEKSRKTLVIFFDQILSDDYRALRILEKIN